MPASSLRKGEEKQTIAQMKALLASRTAKSVKEIVRIVPSSPWASGRYVDSKLPYKKISGAVLWKDKNGDGLCRFTSYDFIKTKSGGSWSKRATRAQPKGLKKSRRRVLASLQV